MKYLFGTIVSGEECLIIALCKFCAGSSQSYNFAKTSLVQAPTFLGRAWPQLMEENLGGVKLLVTLLIKHKENIKLQNALYKALLGIEHNYSFKEKVS